MLSKDDRKREADSRAALEALAEGKWRLTCLAEAREADALLGVPAAPARYVVERLGLANSVPRWETASVTEALSHATAWEMAQSRLKPELRAAEGNSGVPEIVVQLAGDAAQTRARLERIGRGESMGATSAVLPGASRAGAEAA